MSNKVVNLASDGAISTWACWRFEIKFCSLWQARDRETRSDV